MRLLNCDEVATAPGVVYEFACRHRLPLLSICGKYMIPAADLESYRMAKSRDSGPI
jgi:hypothetical protein